jgi:CrcB protein
MRFIAYAYFFVATGGALGAMARYGLNVWLQRDYDLPFGTLSANLLGCLILGIVAQFVASSEWFNASGVIPDQYRLLFAVGFCGSFTTLSAMMFELNVFLQRNDILIAFTYLFATIVGGFACFYAGVVVTRTFLTGASA